MIYAELSSPQIEAVASRGVAVLPIAAIEQHGRHLPLETDAIIARTLGSLVERELPDEVVLLPGLSFGSSDHHFGFPGTLSLSPGTFSRVLMELVESLGRSGFRRIVILNGHGGNHGPAASAMYELKVGGRMPSGSVVALATYWKLADEVIRLEGFMETPCLSHACEYETSLMLAINRKLVCMDRAEASTPVRGSSFYDPMAYRPSPVVIVETFRELSVSGALGRPDLATEEKGRRLLRIITDRLVAFVREVSSGRLDASASA